MPITKILTLFYPLAILHGMVVLIAAVLSPAPGLYIGKSLLQLDRLSFGWLNSTTYAQVTNGYDLPIAWRYSLPGVVSHGVTPYSFRIDSSNMVLSYQA